ncbi:MAG TPA: M56 family metallopeptidase [Terriglobia bacterium]|jgi:TonB family protein
MSFALSIIARSSLILIGAAMACLALRRASAAKRHAVWVLAIAGALLLPPAVAILPQLQLPVLPAAERGVQQGTPATHLTVVGAESGFKRPVGYSTTAVLGVLWGAGLGFFLTRFLAGLLGVLRLAGTVDAEDETWQELVGEVSRCLGSGKQVRLLFSEMEVAPMTWGFRRHRILLPASAREWRPERRRLVLAHELAHVKRSDGVVHLFVQLACSVYWFNPLIWFAARSARIERERACDDQVLNLGGAAEDYAEHLVQIVRGLQVRKSLGFTAMAMAQPSQLEARLVSLLDSRARRRAMSTTGLVTLSLLTALITIGVASINLTGAVPLPPRVVAVPKPVPPPEPETETPPVPSQRTHIGDNATVTTSTVTPPQVIESTGPLYAAIEGIVTLEASVDIQGHIKTLRVLKGITDTINQRAIDAVMNWRFAPAFKDGLPVAAITQIDVEFKLPPDAAQPLRMGPDIKPPTVVSRVEPQYGAEARAAKVQGTVVLEVVIHKEGTVDIRRVVHSLGYGLDASAIEALKQWVFKPATKDGVPVDVAINVEVNFNLR